MAGDLGWRRPRALAAVLVCLCVAVRNCCAASGSLLRSERGLVQAEAPRRAEKKEGKAAHPPTVTDGDGGPRSPSEWESVRAERFEVTREQKRT